MSLTPALLAAALRAAADALEGGATPGKPTGGAADKPAKAAKAAAKPAEPEAPETEHTYEEISALVVRISKEKGRDAVIDFLAGFKNPANKKPATKGAEIAPADYDDAFEKATALLEEGDFS